jgi:hypothetical protein
MLRPLRLQHLQYLQLPSMSPRWLTLPGCLAMAANMVTSTPLHFITLIHTTPSTIPSPSTVPRLRLSLLTSPLIMVTIHTILTEHLTVLSMNMCHHPLAALHRPPQGLRRHRHRLMRGSNSPHLRLDHRSRWTCRIRRVLTNIRSNAPASKPSGQLSTRAEEKKLRRSTRNSNPNQAHPLPAKPPPTSPKQNALGPKPVLKNPNQASNAAKLQHRREKRAWKYQKAHPGLDVPKQMTGGNAMKQVLQHEKTKK